MAPLPDLTPLDFSDHEPTHGWYDSSDREDSSAFDCSAGEYSNDIDGGYSQPSRSHSSGEDNGSEWPVDHSDSDLDSDVGAVYTKISKLDEELRAFVSTYRGVAESDRTDSIDGEPTRHHRRRKKACEATGEAKLRLNQASDAFIAEEYDRAMELVQDVVRPNAGIPDAWSLLSAIYHELDMPNEAAMALLFSVQLRPRDVEALMNCADSALRWLGGAKALEIARQCYSAVLRADSRHVHARLGKAAVEHDLGNVLQAISQYSVILEQDPLNPGAIRGLGEACLDGSSSRRAIEHCKDVYRRFLTWALSEGGHVAQGEADAVTWSDITMYSELSSSLGLHAEAIADLKSLGRWLFGRGEDATWDAYVDDDREWDPDDARRLLVANFDPTLYPPWSYHLPIDVHLRLVVYRLRAGNEEEAKYQLESISYSDSLEGDRVPGSIREIADLLFEGADYREACRFYEPLRHIPGHIVDVPLLVQLGTCYFKLGRDSEAEECYIAAIDQDATNVEARVQLAKVYEKAHEDEEAYILVTEAMRLAREQQEEQANEEEQDVAAATPSGRHCRAVGGIRGKNGGRRQRPMASSRQPHHSHGSSERPRKRCKTAGAVVSRYRPRRLVSAEQRREQERARTEQLKDQYKVVQSLREDAQMVDGPSFSTWMDAAKTLVDDFRSFKEFYHWEKYLRFLRRNQAALEIHGTGNENHGDIPFQKDERGTVNPQLVDMAARLTKQLAPSHGGGEQCSSSKLPPRDDYLGIPFGDWLDLFLEYALNLARSGQAHDAYQVCESARDSIIFLQSHEDLLLIHTVWGACAVHAMDEQTCIAVARFFMRNYQLSADSSRMFSALSRLCQAPVCWYSSGPAQKYILRQIRAVDQSLAKEGKKAPDADTAQLSVCLNMLYGSILFASTSYTYALNYFLRAHAIDPENPAICLSIGLSYIHYSIKRQCDNRQYLILQAFTFLFKYQSLRTATGGDLGRMEADYNMGRAYQMLGLGHLAAVFYQEVFKNPLGSRQGSGQYNPNAEAVKAITAQAGYNLKLITLMAGNARAGLQLLERLIGNI